jgi:hypothetical protein
MRKKKRLEVYQAAVKLARSGKERDWKSIQEKLVEAGYRRAPDLLENSEIRAIRVGGECLYFPS